MAKNTKASGTTGTTGTTATPVRKTTVAATVEGKAPSPKLTIQKTPARTYQKITAQQGNNDGGRTTVTVPSRHASLKEVPSPVEAPIQTLLAQIANRVSQANSRLESLSQCLVPVSRPDHLDIARGNRPLPIESLEKDPDISELEDTLISIFNAIESLNDDITAVQHGLRI